MFCDKKKNLHRFEVLKSSLLTIWNGARQVWGHRQLADSSCLRSPQGKYFQCGDGLCPITRDAGVPAPLREG